MTRRSCFLSALAALAATPALAQVFSRSTFQRHVAALEKRSGGRLGVAFLDTASGLQAGHRADERFPMCSTFKLLAVAAVLERVDRRQEHLERVIRFTAQELLPNSPLTKAHVASGMPVEELCAAAITLSDNTAANLLLNIIGGPAGVTAFARRSGDSATRLDRTEPDLNQALPGDPRDTTTPAAMLSHLRSLVLGVALSPSSKSRLTEWLIRNQTGDRRLRAGLPPAWKVGDKTGSGERGTANDVAIVWPPHRAPFLIAVYLTGAAVDSPHREQTIAAVARIVSTQLTRAPKRA